MRKASLLWLLSSMLLACSSDAENIAAESPDEVQLVEVSAKERPTPAPTAPKEAPSPLDAWVLPSKTGPTLGSSCAPTPPPDGKPGAKIDVCGTQKRVAIEVQDTAMRERPPCKLRSIGRGSPGMYSSVACVDGDHLVINNVCVVCRQMDAGSAAHVRMSELTPEQHKHLHTLAGLKDGPTTPAAWRALVAKGPDAGAPEPPGGR